MNERTERANQSILRILKTAQSPLGSVRLGRLLKGMGIKLSERSIRMHLRDLDERGLTRLASNRDGRVLTPDGEEEADESDVIEKLDFTASRIDALSCTMTLDIRNGHGSVILNLSFVKEKDMPRVAPAMARAFADGWSMGTLLMLRRAGEEIGGITVHKGEIAIGTVCSFTVNGALLRAGIPVRARYGGLVEVRNLVPHHFTTLVAYEGTTIDPLETFIRAAMTSVTSVCQHKRGIVGASFRDVPGVALDKTQKVLDQLKKLGLASTVDLGQTNQPLLGVPVGADRAGLVAVSGINTIAVAYEMGIKVRTYAMACQVECRDLENYETGLSEWL